MTTAVAATITSTTLGYHPGELLAQDKAGTRGAANELLVGRSGRLNFARNHDAFLAAQSFAAVCFVDTTTTATTTTTTTTTTNDNSSQHHHHHVWVTPLFGKAGDITAASETDITISPDCIPVNDPLHDVSPGTPLSLIAIDLSRRIRHRINGVAGDSPLPSAEEGGASGRRRLVLPFQVEEYTPNCPKYINRRELVPSPSHQPAINQQAIRQHRHELSDADQVLLHEADTLWIGTYAPGVGADCNHRGGKPGFIRVVDPSTIEWPEYRGNGMFYTSGNLAVHASAGVTIVDFATGTVLQMTGRAEVDWHHDGSFEGATRVIRLHIVELVRTDEATSHRWTLLDYSPYNPAVVGDGEGAEDSNSNNIVKVTLAKIVQESDDVKTFRWIAPRRIPFLPGQYGTFEFANVPGGQTSEIRTWTLSETPNSILGDNTLDITVKRKGLVTNWLHDNVQVGLEAKLHGIQGDLTALGVEDDDDDPQNGNNKKPIIQAKHLLLVSAGIGITPNMAMIRGIGAFRLEDQVTIHMIHIERYEKDLLFQSELARRSHHYPHFTLTNIISSREGRLTRERLDELIPTAQEGLRQQQVAYLCGPSGFMTATTEYLVQLGVPPDQIHTESFDF
jgi:uncharacterized protein